MNFIKNSIFCHQPEEEEAYREEPENQMLAVWGSPGCGKTTVASKLAMRLAMQKQDVALLLCDMNTPMLPCICPPGELEEEHSLGSILAAAHVTENLVRHHCITHKKLRHLTILGMRKGENEYTYPQYERVQAEELLECLRKIAPCIIIDCSSYIANDILSAVSLMEADSVLRLTGCDLQSVSYFSSQLPLLKESKWDADKQYKAASNVRPNEASAHMEQVLGNTVFQIPYSREVEEQVLQGNLFKELGLKESRGFRRAIEAVTVEVWMLGERRSRAGWCADLSEAFKNPDVEETEAATEREQKEEKGRLPENRPCTGKEPGRMKSSDLFFASGESRGFSSVLREVQGYLSKEYSGLVTAGGSDEVKAQIRRFAGKYIQDHRICVAGMGTEELIDAIYSEMAEFGFLTKYVYGEGIEEIDINAWDDVEVQFSGGETRKLEEHFESPEHAVNVVRRMLHVSGMVLDDASPSVLGHLAKNIRIAVLKTPVVDEDVGVAASIRIVNPQNMKKEDFIDGGTATEEMLDFLAECIRYGISVCVAGATSSGKTTLLGWLLTTIPDNKRIYSIENGSRELALVRRKEGRVVNSVIHTLTRDSENERQRIDQTALLDMALRFNPDIIVVGEMRGPEANAAQEAARTGVAVVTTIHSMSCDATYRRMVSLCKRAVEMRDETLMGFVTEAYPIVAFCKQLENKERRLMEIMECEILPDGTRSFRPLFEYQIEENRIENGKFIVKGSHRRVNAISDSLRRRLMENGMPQEMLVRLAAPLNGRKGQKK